jgi:hypothetical protein
MAVSVQEPPLRQKVIAAAGAACVSVLVVNPLDVVKVRQQKGQHDTPVACPQPAV